MKNEGYWNPKRIPKTDRLVLVCAPEDSSRSAALLSNSVDMIETPPPDAVARLKQAGMRIEQNVTPHVWNYHPSCCRARHGPTSGCARRPTSRSTATPSSSANGLAKPALGQVDPSSPWFGKPSFVLKYPPDEARKLMSEAGFSKTQPLKTKFVVASGGAGQMLSLP